MFYECLNVCVACFSLQHIFVQHMITDSSARIHDQCGLELDERPSPYMIVADYKYGLNTCILLQYRSRGFYPLVHDNDVHIEKNM